MYSQMFRRETARRLLAMTDQVIELYHGRRYPWLNAYQFEWRAAIQSALDTIIPAVAEGDISRHQDYTARQTEEYLELGMPPIAILAAQHLLHEIILSLLTLDQQKLVKPLLEAEQVKRQQVVQEYLLRRIELPGA